MLKHAAIKKYGKKLLPKLQERYGNHNFYSASQVRATVYQCNFNPKYLPLGYLLFLEENALTKILSIEFPDLCIDDYKAEMCSYLDRKKYHGSLSQLIEEVA
ncbi:DUF6559 family protein [Litorilituus sediminis]|uniref:Uncharacterized protein n=1 Tax=Litorilituus sediminis TaxID=718192 RepID=A0A4P6P1U9_9GAMM|nr:DUF6559 family protein [Litorilituus sediminis]QBG35326.1 hypothetical protein EMK97_06120 [Litorilituus sediminis]